MNSADMEVLVRDYAPGMAKAMLDIAKLSGSEEDIRLGCSQLITGFLKKANISVRGQHEYGLAGGRIDSLYGGVIIEYKDPKGAGKISFDRNAPGTKAVIKQIQGRFVDFQKVEKIEPGRLFAAGCDGNNIVFVRNQSGKFDVETPQPVTTYTVSRLLRALVSLGAQGKSFTPDNLDLDFGGQSSVAQKGIADLYNAILNTQNPKAQTFFKQWQILFGEVCGYDMTERNQLEKIAQLGKHYEIDNPRPTELLFAVQSYYAVFMKFLAAEIASSFSPLGTSILKRCIAAPTGNALRAELQKLEQGGIWTQLGITNFLEGDLFSWYLDAWDEPLADVMRSLVGALDQYDPTTLSVEPAQSRDILKKLYHRLFPRSVRHDLGEYYTPDWLAEFTLDELEYDGDPDKRLLDPACGSGTFLVMAINRVKGWYEQNRDQCGFGEAELIQKILTNIIGFDLNPLAVMAARTNYLIALRELLKSTSGIELPVYLCDAIMTPSEYSENLFVAGELGKVRKLKTAGGTFHIPAEICTPRETLGKYADILESCIRDGYKPDEFVTQCEDNGLPVEDAELHRALYLQLQNLHSENRNGIWARIIKNAFAPLFIGEVDYVAGNPPWVNWESLPGEYRQATTSIWDKYSLRPEKGETNKMRGGKKDLSMLFVHGAVDCYLKDGGKIGYVITQTLFKTKGAGDGFRQFRYLTNDGVVLIKPLRVNDLSSMQVFDGATNRTAVFVAAKYFYSRSIWGDQAIKQAVVSYPVPYITWRGRSHVAQETSLPSFKQVTTRRELGAVPIEVGKLNSPWLTAPASALSGIRKVVGKSQYTGHEGVNSGGLNGCFWLRILSNLSNDTVLVENMGDIGKIKVPCVQAAIENALVYPLLRGRDVQRWSAVPSCYIVAPQDPIKQREGIAEGEMKRTYPKTFAFLKQFKIELTARADRKYYPSGSPFYTMRNMADYSLSAWKVMWPEVGNTVRAGVCGPQENDIGNKVAIPSHTIVAVSCDNSAEAYYLAAMLNSAPAQITASGYIVLHPSPHILEHIAIPRFTPDDVRHMALATLSEQCHTATALGNVSDVPALETQVDALAAGLWNIDTDELAAIHEALIEMKATISFTTQDEAEEDVPQLIMEV